MYSPQDVPGYELEILKLSQDHLITRVHQEVTPSNPTLSSSDTAVAYRPFTKHPLQCPKIKPLLTQRPAGNQCPGSHWARKPRHPARSPPSTPMTTLEPGGMIKPQRSTESPTPLQKSNLSHSVPDSTLLTNSHYIAPYHYFQSLFENRDLMLRLKNILP